MSIRTTITLDEELLERIRAESRKRGATFRDTLHDLLRLALAVQPTAAARRSFRVKAHHMGYRPELNYDSIESLLEYGEGGSHR